MEMLTLVAIVVAVVVGAATVIAARRWGNRRRKLLVAYESGPLLPPEHRGGPLKITYRDIPVEDPYLVTIRLKNVGPWDIATEYFDSGEPFVVRLNCTMYGVTRTTDPDSTVSSAIGAEGTIQMKPRLLRRGDEWTIDAVVQGVPSPEFESPLIDTDIIEGATRLDQVADLLSGAIFELPFGIRLQVPR